MKARITINGDRITAGTNIGIIETKQEGLNKAELTNRIKNRNHATKVLTGLNPLTGIKINPITRIREIRNTEINNAGPVIAPTTAMLRLLPMLNLNKIN